MGHTASSLSGLQAADSQLGRALSGLKARGVTSNWPARLTPPSTPRPGQHRLEWALLPAAASMNLAPESIGGLPRPHPVQGRASAFHLGSAGRRQEVLSNGLALRRGFSRTRSEMSPLGFLCASQSILNYN